jgi:hypothetical protein
MDKVADYLFVSGLARLIDIVLSFDRWEPIAQSHNWETMPTDIQGYRKDPRRWTWHSNNMDPYMEWTVRCDGALYAGGIILFFQCEGEWSYDVITHYKPDGIELPERIDEHALAALCGALARGDDGPMPAASWVIHILDLDGPDVMTPCDVDEELSIANDFKELWDPLFVDEAPGDAGITSLGNAR